MITITQMCDGCARDRTIKEMSDYQNGGWRTVDYNVHLCPDCIRKATNR